MYKKPLVWLTLAALAMTPMALAQEPPAAVSVLTVHTKLGQQPQYETSLKDIWAAFKKAGLTKPIFVGSGVSEPGVYTFAVPLANLSDMDSVNATIGQAYASIPSVMQKINTSVNSWDQEVWLARADLSYTPATPRVPDPEQGFTRIVFLYPYPDQVQAFEGVMKEANALRKKYNLGDATAAYSLSIGSDGPAFAVLIGAKDEADFFVENAKALAKMAADWQPLMQKSGPMLRKIAYASEAARNDLGYTP